MRCAHLLMFHFQPYIGNEFTKWKRERERGIKTPNIPSIALHSAWNERSECIAHRWLMLYQFSQHFMNNVIDYCYIALCDKHKVKDLNLAVSDHIWFGHKFCGWSGAAVAFFAISTCMKLSETNKINIVICNATCVNTQMHTNISMLRKRMEDISMEHSLCYLMRFKKFISVFKANVQSLITK